MVIIVLSVIQPDFTKGLKFILLMQVAYLLRRKIILCIKANILEVLAIVEE